MNHRPAVRALLWLGLLLSAAMVLWGLRGGPVVGSVPMTPRPGTSATTAPASADPTPMAASLPRATPSESPSEASSPPTAEGLADLEGVPVHLEIRQDGEILVSAPTGLTQLNGRGELYPEPRTIGWYGPPQWATVPGNESAHPGVFAGHVTYGGVKDVFYRLGDVKAGAVITVVYSDDAVATFVVDGDAVSAPKDDVTAKADTDFAWVWSLGEPGRRISVFSCDPSQGRDLAGHSRNNWVVQATRTA